MKDSVRNSIIVDFVKYVNSELGLKKSPEITLTQNKNFAVDNRSFGGYFPGNSSITVYVKNRNLADILRTLAHEMVHHMQLERGEIESESGKTGSEQENQANQMAGVLLRNYSKVNPMIYESVDYSILTEDLKKYQIYCDMDGVLCDFDAQCDHYFGMSPNEIVKQKGEKGLITSVDDIGVEFWENMPWTSHGQDLWKRIGKFGVIMLTSPSVFEHAKQGKVKWIQKNLDPQPTEILFRQTGKKHEVLTQMSREDRSLCVLIDDWNHNLVPWKKAGGIPIKHTEDNPGFHIIDKLDEK